MLDSKSEGRNPLPRLLAAYLLWTAAGVLGGSFSNLYFRLAGISLNELVISYFFWAAAPILVIHALDGRKLDMRAALVCGVLLQALAYSLQAFLAPSAWVLYLTSFLIGMTSFLFWVPFNIMYFELGKGREALLGSVYFAVNPLLGIFLPIIGGAIAGAYGFGPLFALAALTYLTIVPFAFLALGSRGLSFRIRDCIKGLKGFKTLLMLEGAYGGGVAAAMGVIVLFYFSKPAELGMYLSVTTLFSVLASFIVSRLSDRSRKRKRYVSLFGSGLGVTTAIMSLASTAFLWSAAVSVRNFFSSLFYPFTTAILMDNKQESAEGAFVGREWLLNYGRILGVAMVLFCSLALRSIPLSLAFLGLLILAYPAVIGLKKRHIRVE